MEPRNSLISIVFSFRNEAQNIAELISRVDTAFAGLSEDYEMIFVNDCSSDKSLDILLQERKRNPRVKIVNMSRRFGVAECVRAGMQWSKGDAVIYMDADLQDPPELIPKLIGEWRRGAQVVHTIRSRRQGESPVKMWLTRQAYRAIRFGSTVELPVEAGDFKLLSRQAVEHLLKLPECDPYLRGLVVWVGFSQVSIPYERAPRNAGETHFPIFSRNPWKTLASGLTSFSFVPIYAWSVLAASGLLLAVILIVFGVCAALLEAGYGTKVALLGLAVFFWATILGAISTTGIYVIRIYKDVRGRPQYVVESTVGFDESNHSVEK
jgi:glycosyltransferase involved in cell wall biosynthesis